MGKRSFVMRGDRVVVLGVLCLVMVAALDGCDEPETSSNGDAGLGGMDAGGIVPDGGTGDAGLGGTDTGHLVLDAGTVDAFMIPSGIESAECMPGATYRLGCGGICGGTCSGRSRLLRCDSARLDTCVEGDGIANEDGCEDGCPGWYEATCPPEGRFYWRTVALTPGAVCEVTLTSCLATGERTSGAEGTCCTGAWWGGQCVDCADVGEAPTADRRCCTNVQTVWLDGAWNASGRVCAPFTPVGGGDVGCDYSTPGSGDRVYGRVDGVTILDPLECRRDSDCVRGDCQNGICTCLGSAAGRRSLATFNVCAMDDECCSGGCFENLCLYGIANQVTPSFSCSPASPHLPPGYCERCLYDARRCSADADCASGRCIVVAGRGYCGGLETGAPCQYQQDCRSGICEHEVCRCRESGASCAGDEDCCGGFCDPAVHVCRDACAALDQACSSDADCCSGACDGGRCSLGHPGSACVDVSVTGCGSACRNMECASRSCVAGECGCTAPWTGFPRAIGLANPRCTSDRDCCPATITYREPFTGTEILPEASRCTFDGSSTDGICGCRPRRAACRTDDDCCDYAAGPGHCVAGVCACVASCAGRECGLDDCGNPCPSSCGPGQVCNGNACCTPSCSGRACGSDGCGGECPNTCSTSQVCTPFGACCTPTCAPGSCGDDGCGGRCACGAGTACRAGACLPYTAGACNNRSACVVVSAVDVCPGGLYRLALTNRCDYPVQARGTGWTDEGLPQSVYSPSLAPHSSVELPRCGPGFGGCVRAADVGDATSCVAIADPWEC